jgi:hypothetical protein
MKNKMQLAIFFIWTAVMSPTSAQNHSAPCEGADISKWNNCIGESTIWEGDLFLRYEGPWKNGQYNGFGILTIHTGSKYTGEFKNNLYNGQGTFIWADGRKYVGAYINGKRNGQGIMTYADGSNYVGEWKDGLRAGRGTIYMPNGSVASDGLWANDKPLPFVDKASDVSSDSNRKLDQKEQPAQTTSVAQVAKEALLRKWKDTGFPVSQLPFCAPNVFNKCFGSGKTSNGDEYIGDFDNGQLVGRGIAIFSNGDKYVGEHNKGINGQGIYYFSRPGFQGTILVGEYRDNIPSGNGIYFNADGSVGESGLYSSNLIEFRFVDPAIFTRIPLGKIPIISSADRVAIEIKQAAITKKQAEDQRGAALLKQEAAEVKARQDAATKESQQPSGSFIYVSKLTPDQIRSKFFGSDEWKIRINHFLLNYRFIEYFPILVNSNLEGAHILKTQFQPYLSDMVKAKDGMDNVLKNFAKSLNVQPEIIYRAFGIVYDNQGKIIESYGGSLATGRKMATDYFYGRPINDFFDSRNPRSLFTGWYPQLISSFNSDVPQILALAVSTEANLKKEYLDAEQAAEKGQLERDRQRVLDEQKTYGQKLNLPPPLDLAKDQTELKAACVSATWEYSSRVRNNSLGPSQWANCVSLGMYGDPKFIPYMNAWRATFRNGTFDIGSLGAYHDRCFRDFIVTVDSSGRCMSVFDATPTSRTNVK